MTQLLLPEQLDTSRLVLQRLKYEDAEEIFYAYASKPEATRYVSWPTHSRIKETRDYLECAIKGWNMGIDFTPVFVTLFKSGKWVKIRGFFSDLGVPLPILRGVFTAKEK